MRSASDADFTGWKSPAAAPTTAAHASTIISTSAGLLAPSLLIRSSSCSSPPRCG
jgi:hypothetical protein